MPRRGLKQRQTASTKTLRGESKSCNNHAMTNNQSPRESLTILARDCAASIVEDLNFALSDRARFPTLTFPFISDDRCDYNNAAADLLALLIPAICDLDDDDTCPTLFNAILNCDIQSTNPHSPMRCIHDAALDFNSPIFDLFPDDDDCPNFD